MKYQTTNLQPTKRYPTYQFHARTAQKKLPAEQVFCICVLETLHWLRSRLKKFSSLPEDICTPEPAQYEAFSMQQLHSFHSSVGAAVDVIYLENRGLWSFQIIEPDIGANLGTPQERPAVSGRIFETEISFLLCKDDVEVGVRTICSEPSDSTAPCEVFRPMIIPALAQNPHVGFLKNGFLLNGKAMEIRKKSDIAYFDALCHAADFDMPLVVVADSGTVQKKLDLEQLDVSAVPKLQPLSAELSAHNDMLHFYDRNVQMNEAESTVTKNLQQPLNRRVKRHVSSKMKLKPEAALPAKAETTEKLPVFPFEKLAEKLLGFGVVCFVEHRCLEEFSRKYKLALQEGDMLILRHGSTAERYPYAQYARDMDGFSRQRKQELRQMLKRGAFTFGRILFHSDARLAVLQDSQQETLSLEERCRILTAGKRRAEKPAERFYPAEHGYAYEWGTAANLSEAAGRKRSGTGTAECGVSGSGTGIRFEKKFLSAVYGDRAVLSGKGRHCRDIPHRQGSHSGVGGKAFLGQPDLYPACQE